MSTSVFVTLTLFPLKSVALNDIGLAILMLFFEPKQYVSTLIPRPLSFQPSFSNKSIIFLVFIEFAGNLTDVCLKNRRV